MISCPRAAPPDSAAQWTKQATWEKRMKQANKLALALALLALGYGPANAAPVVYSAYAVTDGQLGSWTFTRAMVVIRLKGDTRNTVTTTQGSATVYINDVGSASVTIN